MQTAASIAPTTPRWAGVGCSTAVDSALATAQAVGEAVGARAPALVLLFVSPRLDPSVVGRTARDLLGEEVVVVGATTAGEIAGTRAGSGHLVAFALGGGLAARVAVGRLADGARTAGQAAAGALGDLPGPHRLLLLVGDGLAGRRAELIRGAYSVAGAQVPLVGGCAGDELAMQRTVQLSGTEVFSDAVIGVAVSSEGPIGVGVGHGWRRTGDPLVVTESDGERIFRLDDQPALDFYLGLIGAPPEAFEPGEGWKAPTLWHPIGLGRPGGQEVRAVIDVDHRERSLFCGDVPQGTLVWAMEGDRESVLEGTRTACREVVRGLGGRTPVGLIAFDCVSRRAVLGDAGIATEVELIAEHFPGVPVGGLYTYGEFSRTRGSRGVHTTTLVLVALT